MPDSAWAKKYAFYAASQFRLGNVIDAGFTASVLFEKYIQTELQRHHLEISEYGEFLRNAITQLSEMDGRTYNFANLNSLRKIRNRSVIHSDETFENYNTPEVRRRVNDDIRKLVTFIWRSLDKKSFARYRDLDAIPHIHADMAVMGVREFFEDNRIALKTNLNAILEDDFNDLIHMRRHFLQLSEYLQNGLLKKYQNLEVDLVSHVDTSSGYVWLAINHTRPEADHLRDRIRHSSASIFATPLDLRISIDFGGEDFLGRSDYYSFLETEELHKFVAANKQLSCIDLEWYSFVTGCEPVVQAFANERFTERVATAKNKLNFMQSENRIVTFERMLLGYVLPRGRAEYSRISEMLDTIIELYFRLERYREEKLNRNNSLTWAPKFNNDCRGWNNE